MNISNVVSPLENWLLARTQASIDQKREARQNTVAIQPNSIGLPDVNQRFYSAEEAPWIALGKDKKTYVEDLREKSNQVLHDAYDDYHGFKMDLPFTHPDLSEKHFGFTLKMDLSIEVTDPDGVLTPAEVDFLTDKLNGLGKLKENLQQHARTVMELVDHDSEKFSGQYRINLESYKKVIDYGQIFSRNTIGNFMDTWAYQIERYADKREASRVDTEA